MYDYDPEQGPHNSGPELLPMRIPDGIAGLVARFDTRLNLEADLEELTGTPQVREPSVLQQTAEILALMIPLRR